MQIYLLSRLSTPKIHVYAPIRSRHYWTEIHRQVNLENLAIRHENSTANQILIY